MRYALFFVVLSLTSSVFAQDAEPDEEQPPSTAQIESDESDGDEADGVVIIEVGETVIPGEIDLPEATYVIAPTAVNPGAIPSYTALGRDPRGGGEPIPDNLVDQSEDDTEAADE